MITDTTRNATGDLRFLLVIRHYRSGRECVLPKIQATHPLLAATTYGLLVGRRWAFLNCTYYIWILIPLVVRKYGLVYNQKYCILLSETLTFRKRVGNYGCDGGEDYQAYNWIIKNGGLAAEENYEYLGQVTSIRAAFGLFLLFSCIVYLEYFTNYFRVCIFVQLPTMNFVCVLIMYFSKYCVDVQSIRVC